MDIFTGYVSWANGEGEQIDVEANSLDEAKVLIQKALDEDYQPGGSIVSINRRTGLFM